MNTHFDARFFANNRRNLSAQLGGGPLIVMTANTQMQRGYDVAYRFEQESNFWYLTGIEQPDWRLIMDGASQKCWLVAPDVDPIKQLFDGALNPEAAAGISGIKEVIDDVTAKQLLARLRRDHTIVQTIAPQTIPPYYGFAPNPAQRRLVKELGAFQVQDCRKELAKLRAIKQPAELAAMQSAIDVTINGIKTALSGLKKMKYEYEFEAVLNAEFRRTGGHGHFFDPIVASGANACTVHYLENNSPLHKKDWLLVDVGAKVSMYGADIARTVPLSRPTQRAIAVYEAALSVHDEAITMCRPGQSVKQYLERVEALMTEQLFALKLITDASQMREFFPYAISHGLGIDAHDSLGAPKTFEENMVLTVEPGIQIPAENLSVRIEDDILVTADGPKILSSKLPTRLSDLEKIPT